MSTDYMFTSESVTEGHPDKLCDQISDAVVGRYLRQDRMAEVVAECAISTGIVFVAARVASSENIDIPRTAREVIERAGYDHNGFDVRNCTVMTSVTNSPLGLRQEIDEATLDDEAIDRLHVRDQSTVFGYANDHSPGMLPLPIWLSNKLARRIVQAYRDEELPYLAPDGKTQVGVEFRDRRPRRIHSVSIVASQRHEEFPHPSQLQRDLLERVIQPAFADEAIRADGQTHYFINPGGPVIAGGPSVHSGMTGRKTSSDTYGEFCRCSASALSGKDPGRIDRVGVYAARYAAKNVVAARLAHECEIQLSYTIGLARPVSIQINTFGSSRIEEADLLQRIQRTFDFRLGAIIRQFQLRDLPMRDELGFYPRLAAYGHVGRLDLDLPWERTDCVEQLQEA